MSGQAKAPLSSDHSLPSVAPLGVDLAVLVANYGGPVMVVDADDGIVAANASARSLVEEDNQWWLAMASWLAAVRRGEGSEKPDQLARFDHGGTTTWVAWRPVGLTDGRLLLLGRDATPEYRLRQRLQLAGQHATMDRQLREALTESRGRYKDLVEISSDFAWETDASGQFVFVSPAGALGWTAAALVGCHPRGTLANDEDMPLPFETRRPVERLVLWLRDIDGEAACMEVSAKPLYGQDGAWNGARGVCRNLTEQVTRSAELARIRNRECAIERVISVLRDHLSPEKAFTLCARETAQALGATTCVIYGFDAGAESPIPVASFGNPVPDGTPALHACLATVGPVVDTVEDSWVLACAARFQGGANGAVVVRRSLATETWDEDDLLLIAGIAERVAITHAQVAFQARLRHLSERDGLTGLFNRRAFLERLDEVLHHTQFGPSVLLYMDLDNFKVLNDQRGHKQGDLALSAVAGLLDRNIRPGDVAGRMGGDEFVLWLARADEAVAIAVAERLLVGMRGLEPLSAPGRPLSLSIGIAIHDPASGEKPALLIERADTAMYAAKSGGKNTFSLAPGTAWKLAHA